MYEERKTVITGLGMVTSLGLNVKDTWDNLIKGGNGIKNITLFDTHDLETRFAAEVSRDMEQAADRLITKKDRKRMTRTTKMALLAADEAVRNSGIRFDEYDKTRIAAILGVINTSFNDREREQSESHIIVKSMPNAINGWISILYGIEGPSFNVSTACASSAYAIGLGQQMIRSGLIDVAIVGGADSNIEREYIKGFNQIMALSVRNGSPETACRPFSLSRDGFVMGEGAGILILESEESANKRNASVYSEIGGYALTSEAVNITAPKEDGAGMIKTMKKAMADAKVSEDEVDYINAHGTSTYLNDKFETMAIKDCFGLWSDRIAVSSSKSMLGHTLGAAGAIEGIITALSIKNKILTPTINYSDPDPDLDLDYVPNQAREKEIRAAISNSFGFGGHNASIVFKKYKNMKE